MPYEGIASAANETRATIGSELSELETLVDKLGAMLSPVLMPRLQPGKDAEPPVENPGYFRRLKVIRQRILELMNALEL